MRIVKSHVIYIYDIGCSLCILASLASLLGPNHVSCKHIEWERDNRWEGECSLGTIFFGKRILELLMNENQDYLLVN